MLVKAQLHSGLNEYETSAEENEYLIQLYEDARLREDKEDLFKED